MSTETTSLSTISISSPSFIFLCRYFSSRLTLLDKLTVARARKIQRALTQPFYVGEAFTGIKGKYVKTPDTVMLFKEILDGQHDDKPEQAFYMKGGIDEVTATAAEKTEK